MSNPLPYTWPISIPFWLAYASAFLTELPHIRKTRKVGVPPSDRRSLRLIFWAGSIAAGSAFAVAGTLRVTLFRHFLIPYIAGVAMIVASMFLRRHCFAMLGPRFTYTVQVAPGQEVVQSGAYRYVRHPAYTAGLMMFAGIGLALGNWLSLALCTVIPALAYGYRIAIEERLLVETIGPAYRDYMKRTRRLIPFLF